MKPLISVIVPIFNTGNYLRECIESILSQSFTKLELILENDGSTDQSGDICIEFAVIDSRVKVIHQKNCGSA
ncbi:glycosyltransferase [Bacillus sp. ISL-78]|nr:glycosyltransferase [Bacillus sp. ISL-78]MBT2628975.1 glycosyltransferase [Bacillus sp. ISL-101]MBT2714922.1 glycosyltransferase [Bacillus sp. ISL-57]